MRGLRLKKPFWMLTVEAAALGTAAGAVSATGNAAGLAVEQLCALRFLRLHMQTPKGLQCKKQLCSTRKSETLSTRGSVHRLSGQGCANVHDPARRCRAGCRTAAPAAPPPAAAADTDKGFLSSSSPAQAVVHHCLHNSGTSGSSRISPELADLLQATVTRRTCLPLAASLITEHQNHPQRLNANSPKFLELAGHLLGARAAGLSRRALATGLLRRLRAVRHDLPVLLAPVQGVLCSINVPHDLRLHPGRRFSKLHRYTRTQDVGQTTWYGVLTSTAGSHMQPKDPLQHLRERHSRFDAGLAGFVALGVRVAGAAAGEQGEAAAAPPHPPHVLQRAARLPVISLHLS